jgi:hypothetical protein
MTLVASGYLPRHRRVDRADLRPAAQEAQRLPNDLPARSGVRHRGARRPGVSARSVAIPIPRSGTNSLRERSRDRAGAATARWTEANSRSVPTRGARPAFVLDLNRSVHRPRGSQTPDVVAGCVRPSRLRWECLMAASFGGGVRTGRTRSSAGTRGERQPAGDRLKGR